MTKKRRTIGEVVETEIADFRADLEELGLRLPPREGIDAIAYEEYLLCYFELAHDAKVKNGFHWDDTVRLQVQAQIDQYPLKPDVPKQKWFVPQYMPVQANISWGQKLLGQLLVVAIILGMQFTLTGQLIGSQALLVTCVALYLGLLLFPYFISSFRVRRNSILRMTYLLSVMLLALLWQLLYIQQVGMAVFDHPKGFFLLLAGLGISGLLSCMIIGNLMLLPQSLALTTAADAKRMLHGCGETTKY